MDLNTSQMRMALEANCAAATKSIEPSLKRAVQLAARQLQEETGSTNTAEILQRAEHLLNSTFEGQQVLVGQMIHEVRDQVSRDIQSIFEEELTEAQHATLNEKIEVMIEGIIKRKLDDLSAEARMCAERIVERTKKHVRYMEKTRKAAKSSALWHETTTRKDSDTGDLNPDEKNVPLEVLEEEDEDVILADERTASADPDATIVGQYDPEIEDDLPMPDDDLVVDDSEDPLLKDRDLVIDFDEEDIN